MRSKSGQQAFDPRRAQRTLLRYSTLLILVVVLCLIVLIQIFGLVAVEGVWASMQPAVVAVKWGGMAVLIWQWVPFIHWIARRWDMDDGYRDYLLGMRWRVAIALVVLELLFGQNLIGRMLS